MIKLIAEVLVEKLVQGHGAILSKAIIWLTPVRRRKYAIVLSKTNTDREIFRVKRAKIDWGNIIRHGFIRHV